MFDPIKFHVVDFQHIDDWRCFRPLADAITDTMGHPLKGEVAEAAERQLRQQLGNFFKAAGWEGDGEINCTFIAPCFTSREDSWCETVYHVKQSNNGTSWIAIPNRLRLKLPKGLYSD